MSEYKRDPFTVSNANGVVQTVTVPAEEYRRLKAVAVAAAAWRGARRARLEYAGACNAGEHPRNEAYAAQLLRDDDRTERAFVEVMDGVPAALLRRLGVAAPGEPDAVARS
jgi:ferritin-like protein